MWGRVWKFEAQLQIIKAKQQEDTPLLTQAPLTPSLISNVSQRNHKIETDHPYFANMGTERLSKLAPITLEA